MGASPRRSGRRSAPAATRSARRSPPRTASVLAPGSCAVGSLISGTRPNESCGRPASRRSSGSTSAPRAIPTFSSRIGETGSREACRECWPRSQETFDSLANQTGRVALSPDEVRERHERIRAEVGDAVTIVAATKYVSVEELAVLAEAGIEVVGENRAQDLEAKHAVYGDAFRWHFIGHLQSRKVKTVNAICELLHSLSSESAAKRLEIPALVEVNLSGEETKSGVSEGDLDA